MSSATSEVGKLDDNAAEIVDLKLLPMVDVELRMQTSRGVVSCLGSMSPDCSGSNLTGAHRSGFAPFQATRTSEASGLWSKTSLVVEEARCQANLRISLFISMAIVPGVQRCPKVGSEKRYAASPAYSRKLVVKTFVFREHLTTIGAANEVPESCITNPVTGDLRHATSQP